MIDVTKKLYPGNEYKNGQPIDSISLTYIFGRNFYNNE